MQYLKEKPDGAGGGGCAVPAWPRLEDGRRRMHASAQAASVEAYNYYSQALTRSRGRRLEGLIHVGMGNVLYFQDRYSAAMRELTAGYEKLERDSDKAWGLPHRAVQPADGALGGGGPGFLGGAAAVPEHRAGAAAARAPGGDGVLGAGGDVRHARGCRCGGGRSEAAGNHGPAVP